MATQARDQNLNVIFDGASSGLKNNKLQKNGGRKALGDISNSRRHSANIPQNKLSLKNVISVAEDFVPSSKIKISNNNKGVGRKALGDLTNSVKPLGFNESKKKAHDKKLSAVVEEPFLEEHILHDHVGCVKAQHKAEALELEYIFKEYGIVNSVQSPPSGLPTLSVKMKLESPIKYPEMQDVFELPHNKCEVFVEDTLCASPSPTCFQWAETNFGLIPSP